MLTPHDTYRLVFFAPPPPQMQAWVFKHEILLIGRTEFCTVVIRAVFGSGRATISNIFICAFIFPSYVFVEYCVWVDNVFTET
jgi:hypothetical protein